MSRQFATAILSNGVRLASTPALGSAQTLSLAVRAGSVHETVANRGASHLLSMFGFQSTENRSPVNIIRESELQGVALRRFRDRDLLIWSADFLPSQLDYAAGLLADVAHNTRFEDYEVRDLTVAAGKQTAECLANPSAFAMDLLHNMAFRSGYGNSLFADQAALSAQPLTAVKDFFKQRMTSDNVSLIGYGIDIVDLEFALTNTFKALPTGAEDATAKAAAKYFGGESYIPNLHIEENVMAIAFEGVPLNDARASASIVLEKLLSTNSPVKYGASGIAPYTGKLVATEPASSLIPFSLSYAATGLNGVLLKAPSAAIGGLATDVVTHLKSLTGTVDAAKLTAAKNAAKMELLTTAESRTGATHHAAQHLLLGSATTLASIDAVSAADIQKLVTGMLKSKPTVAFVGDISAAPQINLN
ncbi:hypothetical protein H696_01120 [Fonticula alba]|uniref:Cytochrome b-c1 complex subunit 2, mitochondrial n=1 Tax=Fonticula alba TaxID=691883 RepID=A0A058ZE10_FONAL|nr:hypothetical protein H696_01120 [Fonticula alba]KCV71697.1 hypothetical protein H696_01120 [Fonticula alba]|eukprot:XP_009493275.1 hypothetical protein H696_01120 [Fonticula alba]